MAEYQIDHMRMTIIDENGETIITHQAMADFGRSVTDLMIPVLAPGPAERIGREPMYVIGGGGGKGFATIDLSRHLAMRGVTAMVEREAAVVPGHILDAVRAKVERAEKRMFVDTMMESFMASRGKMRGVSTGADNRSGRAPAYQGRDRFSDPLLLDGPGPIHSPRNNMLVTEQEPEKAPMTRAERRRAEKMKRKP